MENNDVKIKDFYQSIIEYDYDKLFQLIYSGGNVNLKDENGWTPLMFATKNNDSQSVKILLTNGADIDACNYKQQTALMIAAYYNAEFAGNELLVHGANMSKKDQSNRTAYDIAHEKYNSSKNEYFLKSDITMQKKCSYFCNRYLSKIKAGDLINLNNLSELFENNYAYSIKSILLGEIKDFISKTYDIKKINENEIQILPKLPASSEIYSFLKEYICNHSIGSFLYIPEIENSFKEKYKTIFPDINWNEYINKLKSDNIEIRFRNNNGDYLFIASNKFMLLKLIDKFLSEKIGAIVNLSDIKEQIKKCYGIYISEYQASNLIYGLSSDNVIIKPKLEGGFCIRPTEKRVNELIYMYFSNFNLGEIVNKSNLFRDFKIKYDYDLTELEFEMFLSKLPSYNYTLIIYENNEYCIAPSVGKMKHFFKDYFKNAKIGDIVKLTEIKDKYEKYFRYNISDKDFCNIFFSMKFEHFECKKVDNGNILLISISKEIYTDYNSNDLFYRCIGNKRYYN